MTTNKELLVELNALRVSNGKGELASWKASKEKLEAAIVAEQEEQANRLADEGEGINPEDQTDVSMPMGENGNSLVDPLDGEADTSDLSDLEGQSDPSDLTSDVKAPRGAIGALVIELLVTDMPYVDIVRQVRETYPSAKTTARSIASVAMDLRRDGIVVPSRRKPAAPKPAKTPKPAKARELTEYLPTPSSE